MAQSKSDGAAIVLEWSDFDPRLGLRSLGSWDPEVTEDLLNNARQFATFLCAVLRSMPVKFPVSLSSPTLPLPPVTHYPSWHSNKFDLSLKQCVASMLVSISELQNVHIISSDRLDISSPFNRRLDPKSEYASGFPYQIPHASEMAHLHANQLLPLNPKKGLITDLDDTVWLGILGELGVDGISWDLEHGAQGHGSYQRFLQSLSRTGVLLAVASKNNPQLVDEAFRRTDLLLSRNHLYPMEAHWGPKSESVARILKTWNVAADSIVFIDDSPMELAEVKAVHPQIECLLFPKSDPAAILDLQYRLRDLFGKRSITQEDTIRQESIRVAEEFRAESANGNVISDVFLRQAEAELTFHVQKHPLDPRAIELVNKTNQFNLNGKRYTDASWLTYIKQPNTLLVMASYRDKYGPLGKIAVIAGRKERRTLHVDTWVMSCRAFSRRIEHHCIEELFERHEIEEIVFYFEWTPQNGPIQEFLAELLGGSPVAQGRLTRNCFAERRMKTFHKVLETANG